MISDQSNDNGNHSLEFTVFMLYTMYSLKHEDPSDRHTHVCVFFFLKLFAQKKSEEQLYRMSKYAVALRFSFSGT